MQSFSFFLTCFPHRVLYSFPTRRSSDLPGQLRQLLGNLVDGSFTVTVHTFESPRVRRAWNRRLRMVVIAALSRSEEHTSELQSPCNLVCRLLLEKKKEQ